MELLFGVHAHQPVGNPDEIIEKAFSKCYMPFLETLIDFPRVKVAIHISGHLMEWALQRKPYFIELLKELHKRGSIEILGGGFYEPILASIPKEDAINQIKLFSKVIEALFGKKPEGAWLTERVWEPSLPVIFKEADISYTFVDDYHFLCIGLNEENLNGFYHTEHEGYKLFLFPTSQRLRYYIPFKSVTSVLELLSSLNGPGIIFDDYEKFGLWPETYEWVYERGWLREFFTLINQGEIKAILPSELLKMKKSLGLVYLPTVSYFEMGEWSLPAEKAYSFRELTEFLEENNLSQRYKGLIRGGHWKNFLTKYPESNYMHKKMLFISKSIKDLPEGPKKEEAQKHLYRAQCNDAYWHGIFGGIYFPHLRGSVFKELSMAERILFGEEKRVFVEDIDLDGSKEIYIYTPKITCTIKPSLGGSIREITYHPRHVNLIDTLSRRKEHYHMLQGKEKPMERKESISTIHERVHKLNVTSLEFDNHERTFGYEEISLDDGNTWIKLIDREFEIESLEGLTSILRGEIYTSPERKIDFRKKIELVDNYLKIVYPLIEEIPIDLKLFFNIRLTSIKEDYLTLKVDGYILSLEEGPSLEGKDVEIEDRLMRLKLFISISKRCKISIRQIFTISQTEEGYDRTYQSTEFTFNPGNIKEELSVSFGVEEL